MSSEKFINSGSIHSGINIYNQSHTLPSHVHYLGKFTLSQEILLNVNTLRMFIYCKALSYKWELPLL